jgi:hypothetical protein
LFEISVDIPKTNLDGVSNPGISEITDISAGLTNIEMDLDKK